MTKLLAAILALSTAALAAPHSVTLSWDAVTLSTTGTTLPAGVSYSVKRGTVAGGPYTIQASGGAALTYVDSGLPPQAKYCYVVSATLAGVEGANSAELCATTPADPVVPTAPLNLKAVAK